MSGWPMAFLGDVVDVRIGPFGSLLHKEDYAEGGVPLVNPMHLDGGSIVADRRHSVKEEKATELAGYRMVAGDVVLGRRGEMGRCAVVQPAQSGFLCGTGSLFLRPDQRVSPDFLAKLMSSPDMVRLLERESLGTTMPNLNRTIVSNIQIPLPPIEEQRRIAAILDHADALRAKRREALARLDELTQAIFIDMFGDPASNDRGWTAGFVSDFVDGFEGGRNIVGSDDADDGYRVLKVSAVTSLTYRESESKPLPSDYIPPSNHLVREGDLLFSRANTSELVGATAIVTATDGNTALPDKLWRFRWRDESSAVPRYVESLFQRPSFRRKLSERATGSSGSMKNIAQAKVLTISVGIPPLELQRDFAQRKAAIELMKERHRTALTELDALFASLQSRAFRGEL